MKLDFSSEAWSDYAWTVTNDRAAARKINRLFDDIAVNGQAGGIGKPEPLLHNLAGWWSRRITQEHRLVYRVDEGVIRVLSCRFHYE
ncbi:Txe/YoeB family addiction module toxin [Nocardia sp. NPDC058480]|uniref:Txe/YoeB family addiction module toxin n=1 Tax=unclassified Nocardia TaxID=2637762 RepID=UPI003648262A